MSESMTLSAGLLSELAGALAQDKRRMATARRNGAGDGSALAEAVRIADEARRTAPAAAAVVHDVRVPAYVRERRVMLAKLDADRRAGLVVRRGMSYGLSGAALTEFKAARERLSRARRADTRERYLAECAAIWAAAGARMAASSQAFALPILPADIEDGGRFHRYAAWHGLRVGMLSADVEDVVSMAAEFCYRSGDVATLVMGSRSAVLPTIGGMYRNLKRASHALIDQSRRMTSQGLTAVYSLDALGSDSVLYKGGNAERMDAWGFDYAEVGVAGLYGHAQSLEASLDALTEAWDDEQAAAHERARIAGERRAALAVADVTPADRLCVRVLIDGQGDLAALALALATTKPGVQRRLSALPVADLSTPRNPASRSALKVQAVVMSHVAERRAADMAAVLPERVSAAAARARAAEARKSQTVKGGTLAGPVSVRFA